MTDRGSPRSLRYPEEDNFQAMHRLGLTECDGSHNCTAEKHLHGCYSDKGNCERPEAHRV